MAEPSHNQYDVSWNRRYLAILLVLLGASGATAAFAVPGRSWFNETVPICPERCLAATEKINPNTASTASLCRLPGVGPARAKAILDYRHAHGDRPFRSVADLKLVRGLGAGTIERFARYLDLPAEPEQNREDEEP